MKDIIVIGAGGCALEVLGIIENINREKAEWNVLGIVDDNSALKGTSVGGYNVLGLTDILNTRVDKTYAVCGIGKPSIRKKIFDKITNPNMLYPILIDPSAVIADSAGLSEGVIIGAGVLCEKECRIGKHVMINSHSIVGHESTISDYCMIHLGSNIAGQVEMGECCEIGMGTNIIQQLKIGAYTTTGAGSVIVKDISGNCLAAGVPAKILREM